MENGQTPHLVEKNAGFIVVFVLVVIGAAYLALHITTR
jgi:hypothetical protein